MSDSITAAPDPHVVRSAIDLLATLDHLGMVAEARVEHERDRAEQRIRRAEADTYARALDVAETHLGRIAGRWRHEARPARKELCPESLVLELERANLDAEREFDELIRRCAPEDGHKIRCARQRILARYRGVAGVPDAPRTLADTRPSADPMLPSHSE